MSIIISKITNKFPTEYISGALALAYALARNKRDAFWKRYNADKAFQKQTDSMYAYKRSGWFDFWLVTDELREYLKPQLVSAEVLLIERDKVSCLSVKQIEDALNETGDVQKFLKIVLEQYVSRFNIWFELERKLSEASL